jgi:XRE family transcriptional regulator, aerobic/anaerobic benzoate catabolism transcriptional regulator
VADPLLTSLAARVRVLRKARGLSRVALAARSGLSVRFLARVESGHGNISVLRLAALARALDTRPDALLRPGAEAPRTVALVGLRGAGKSTVGPLLAARLGWTFVEMDDWITEASGLSLEELFELHGESYYRRLEHETLLSLAARPGPLVLAAAGGVVNEPSSWSLLRESATVVWLRARPEDHFSRVVGQGDRRPMADHPAAMEQLRELLRAREATYAAAHLTVDTAGRTPDEVASEIARGLGSVGP